MIRTESRGCAVVTGAAGGFGSCFARRLAERGFNLILVDRREEPLVALTRDLANSSGVAVDPVVVDLTDLAEVQKLADQLSGRQVEFLVNNAGFAHLRGFVEINPDRHLEMVMLHVTAPMQLTRAVLPGMIERDCGNIINVSSLGAWLPSGDAQYAATKSYLLVLSESLHDELAGTNVRVQALCPSFVDTGFHMTEEMKRFPKASIPKRFWMKTEDVVDCSLRRLQQNRAVVVPGWRNRIFCFALRQPMISPLIRRIVRKTT